MPIASAEETRKRHEAERARKEQRRRETRNQARNGRRKIRGFRGFDGEGETKWCTLPCECKQYVPRIDNEISLCTACGHKKDSHYHAYVLVGIGDKQIDTETLSIDEIGLEETFEFAYSQFLRPENRDCVFVGFFLGYDFNSIIKSIPNRLAWKLFNPYGNIHSESERKDKNDKRPCSSRKPTLSSRVRDEGKPYPVILTGKRGHGSLTPWTIGSSGYDRSTVSVRTLNIISCTVPRKDAHQTTISRISFAVGGTASASAITRNGMQNTAES